jgi:hypothetical protein
LWWGTKCEDVYLNDYGDGLAAGRGLTPWFRRYDTQRPHSSLDYATPADWYWSPEVYGGQAASWKAMNTACPRATRSIPGKRLITPDDLGPEGF